MTANIPITKTIDTLVQKAKIAQLNFEKYNQEQVNEVITAVAWSICNPLNNKLIAELSVSSTNLGKKEDKIIKNRRKTLGLLRDLQQAKSVGVIQEDNQYSRGPEEMLSHVIVNTQYLVAKSVEVDGGI